MSADAKFSLTERADEVAKQLSATIHDSVIVSWLMGQDLDETRVALVSVIRTWIDSSWNAIEQGARPQDREVRKENEEKWRKMIGAEGAPGVVN